MPVVLSQRTGLDWEAFAFATAIAVGDHPDMAEGSASSFESLVTALHPAARSQLQNQLATRRENLSSAAVQVAGGRAQTAPAGTGPSQLEWFVHQRMRASRCCTFFSSRATHIAYQPKCLVVALDSANSEGRHVLTLL
jgi:hypothetical protein